MGSGNLFHNIDDGSEGSCLAPSVPGSTVKCTTSFSKDFVRRAILSTLPWTIIQQLLNVINFPMKMGSSCLLDDIGDRSESLCLVPSAAQRRFPLIM